MSSTEFGWESLLDSDAPSACALQAALFTTYDRADAHLLAEHLLPALFKLNRESDSEGKERQYFLLELDRRLKQLHDRLVVVSSTAREEPVDPDEGEDTAYAWIWRSIRHLSVGSQRRAVQHAKLWLLHWGAADEEGVEYIEIVVSSANLTRAAFRGQLQGAWRACLALRPKRSEARLAGWGILPDFLRALAESAGEDDRLAYFIELLARADCPDAVTFVASAPGTFSRKTLANTHWGAAGLRKIMPPGRGTVSVSVLSPYVGSWTASSIARWCAAFEGSPKRLGLVWIDKDHLWARANRWILPASTLKSLVTAGATILRLRHDPSDEEETDLFHEEHRLADDRWSHAKLYSLTRGPSRRLLVTSANFSTAAWGLEGDDGNLTIENFELGVCVDQAAWPFDDLEPFEKPSDAATVLALPMRGAALITWARAAWDGKVIIVECRCAAGRKLVGAVSCGGKWTPIADWTSGNLWSAHIPWEKPKQPPAIVQLTCEAEMVNVPVFDERPAEVREHSLPPEVDEDAAQALCDELLFEQYGGCVADDGTDGEEDDDDSGEETKDRSEPEPIGSVGGTGGQAGVGDGGGDETEEDAAHRSDSYGVPAFDLARRHLTVVDNWADRVNLAATNHADFDLQVLHRDGNLLEEAFLRQADRDGKKAPTWPIGAKLAAEEFDQRLKHFPEA